MTTYRDAGVDIQAGDQFVQRIKSLVRTTFRPEVVSDLGGFGGLFRFPSTQYHDPILVSGTDGVGTKLKVAALMDRHDTIGIDLVAMCANDVVVSGAEPLFFLDYLATGKLDVGKAESIVSGIVTGCREAGCALIGGETAEMPSCYPDHEYDLAGFVVGVVEREEIIDGKKVAPGNVAIGLSSTGLHSNGFTLARQVLFEQAGWTGATELSELDRPLGEVLLEPTRIYAKHIRALLTDCDIHGVAHITGGGLTGNVPRVLPEHCDMLIKRGSWPIPHIFDVIQRAGQVDQEEMYQVFNMGIGMVVIVPPQDVNRVLDHMQTLGDAAHVIGEIRQRHSPDLPVRYDE
ncbi:MAG: phosphoribosylformylglycinamidine cyclo-ligase [Nitrospirales bacterium]|nr:MAG: phosphoribosylformylglycinamidine cyclo-ligase [Nitrospirales bacterium]